MGERNARSIPPWWYSVHCLSLSTLAGHGGSNEHVSKMGCCRGAVAVLVDAGLRGERTGAGLGAAEWSVHLQRELWSVAGVHGQQVRGAGERAELRPGEDALQRG